MIAYIASIAWLQNTQKAMADVVSPSDPLKDLLAEFARTVGRLIRDNVWLVAGQEALLSRMLWRTK
jgi:hypothetical protein